MASQYEIAATVINQADLPDDYGFIETFIEILKVLHHYDNAKYDATWVCSAVFDTVMETWSTVDFKNDVGSGPIALYADPEDAAAVVPAEVTVPLAGLEVE